MWLPLTWRTFSVARLVPTVLAHALTHGPAALTSALRADLARGVRPRPCSVARQMPPSRLRGDEPGARADVGAVLARAPSRWRRRAARRRRARRRRRSPCGTAASGPRPTCCARGRRRTTPAASSAADRWSYRKSPARIIHAGRRCGSCGSTNEQRLRRGAARGAAAPRARRATRAPAGTRSTRGSAARRGSAWCSTARSRDARSSCSTSSTLRPRPGGVARDAGAVDAGADDEEVVDRCSAHERSLEGGPQHSTPGAAGLRPREHPG